MYITPARFPKDGDRGANRATPRLLLALVLEAGEHLRCVLGQYHDPAARAERCLREAQLLGAGVGRAGRGLGPPPCQTRRAGTRAQTP